MPLRLTQLYAFFCLFAIQSQAFAQTISINPDSLPTAVAEKVISYETLFVNGLSTHELTSPRDSTYTNLGLLRKTTLTTLTLKLADLGQIKLHESISFTIPDTVERNPFKVAITPHHILTETAGFAVPVLVTDAPLKRYASHVRTAGQIAHDDAVGWAILIRFLEAKTGQSLQQLLKEHVLTPLGLKDDAIGFPHNAGALIQYSEMQGNKSLVTELTRLMIRNRDTNGERYLSKANHDLMTRQQSWRMHPLSPNRTYGGILNRSDNWQWLEPASSPGEAGPSFMAFPDAGIAFIHMTDLTADFRETVLQIAEESFLPSKHRDGLAEANQLVPYERFSGYYVRADQPTAWLQNRLQAIQHEQLYIKENPNQLLSVELMDRGERIVRTYDPIAPFHYKTGNSTITLSPYKSGGYLELDGVLYRYVGILGNKYFVITLFPFVVITLLSAGAYASSDTSHAWRKMGQFGFIGTLMVCTGLICDYVWWPSAIFEWDLPILVNIWRGLLNFGLMLVLSIPLFALSFVRHNRMPEGNALLYVPFHLAILSIAAAMLFLILVAWGSAAEFSAY